MDYDILTKAISAGMLWGTIVTAIDRFAGRKAPKSPERSAKVFFITAIIIAMGGYAMHAYTN